ncbi:hypothetical protein Dimus_022624 [Dionaea muscipula]
MPLGRCDGESQLAMSAQQSGDYLKALTHVVEGETSSTNSILGGSMEANSTHHEDRESVQELVILTPGKGSLKVNVSQVGEPSIPSSGD